eukprot:361811-Lingulodinium_polyedra.AAC.1
MEEGDPDKFYEAANRVASEAASMLFARSPLVGEQSLAMWQVQRDLLASRARLRELAWCGADLFQVPWLFGCA